MVTDGLGLGFTVHGLRFRVTVRVRECTSWIFYCRCAVADGRPRRLPLLWQRAAA